MRSLLFFLCLALALLFGGVASSQPEAAPKAFSIVSKEWARTFEAAEKFVKSGNAPDEQHQLYASALREVAAEAAAIRQEAEVEAVNTQPLLDALGPAPGEGQPAEAREIAQQRQELTRVMALYNARAKQAELALARATALQGEISQALRQRFLARLFERQASPLAPAALTTAAPQLSGTLAAMLRAPRDWYAALLPDQQRDVWLGWRMLTVVGAGAVAWLVRRWVLRRFGPDPLNSAPGYARRLVAALASAVANGIIPSAVLAAVYVRIRTDAVLGAALGGTVAAQLCLALIFIAMSAALARAVLSPQFPTWRLTSLTSGSARRLTWRIVYLAAVYALDQAFVRASGSLGVSPELQSFWSLISGSLEAIGLILLTQANVWHVAPAASPPAEASAPPSPSDTQPVRRGGRQRRWAALRFAVALASVGAVLAMVIGYVQLGSYVVLSLVQSSTVLGALYLLRRLAGEGIALLSSATIENRRLHFGGSQRPDLMFWLGMVVDSLLLVGAAYLLLIIWGVPASDVERWLFLLLSGFKIGGVTISLADIATAMVVFAVGLFLTGQLRTTLHQKFLPRTRLDSGVRNSLATGAGYVGFVLSAVLAIGVVGIDLSNLAIIAGALSVGIGFGLQNIVNNFVSGLILLAERPIKVGDWVVVGSHQGHVKHISVRATEIQTFDRASVILPNSELLSSAVTNWTYKDKSGRVEISVGVAYGSDTRRVRELLLECAAAHEEIVSWPQPFVVFGDFGASTLNFVLYAYLRDVEKRLSVSSDLRFAIDERFREAGLEIPYGQHDVHLKDLDKLLDGLRGLAPPAWTEGSTGASAPVPPASPPEAPPAISVVPGKRDPGSASSR